ncbi:RNA polymerase sigma factor [Dactylosporangium sp. NPDC051541]|uniref:RNA polymerase sigma factor n=1 Tax=Dactylosporangium sp. NPDC051541 TaxID=3363977 RepID=UPI0037990B56
MTAPNPRPAKLLRLVPKAAYGSWEDAYSDNVERLYRLMFARVGDRQDAEDLTAEVFLAAVPRVRLDLSIGEVRAYLLSVARTVLAEHWRRTLGRQVTEIDLEAVADEYAAPDPRPDRAEQVRRVLDALPERYRTILRLRFLESATIREAARQMGVSIANAKVLQCRALRHAAGLFDSDGS